MAQKLWKTALVLQDADQSFRAGQDLGPSTDTLASIGAAALAFLDALARRAACNLPSASLVLPPPPPQPPGTAQAGWGLVTRQYAQEISKACSLRAAVCLAGLVPQR